MPDLITPILAAIVTLAVAWLFLVAVVWLHRPTRERAAALVRLVPDLVRLCYRLARDAETPLRFRIGLLALGLYLASPIDIVPDVLPGIGSLDDIVLAGLTLRSVGRGVGNERIERHWTGSADGLAALRQLLGTRSRRGVGT